MQHHSIPKVGVQHGGPLFGDQSLDKATYQQSGNLNEDGHDLFSHHESASQGASVFFLAPFVDHRGDRENGISIRHYAAFAMTTFWATTFLTIFTLIGRSVLATSGAGRAEMAITMALLWVAAVRIVPTHYLLPLTCNPAIETARTFVMDGTGLVSWAIICGIQLAGGALGGAIIRALGFEAAVMQDSIFPEGHNAVWLMPIIFQAVIVFAFIMAQKYPKTFTSKWENTTAMTALAIFACTVITTGTTGAVNVFSFYTYNPAVFLGAGVALANFGQFALFLLIAFFVAPLIAVAFYYGFRLMIKLTQIDRLGDMKLRMRFEAGVEVGPEKTNASIGSDMGRSSALRNREASTKALSVDY